MNFSGQRGSRLAFSMYGLLLIAAQTMGQWDVPGPIVLDGSTSDQRQVLGLGTPLTTDAAVSLEDLRSVTVSRAAAAGDVILTADLFPAPSAYTPGMVVQITPVQANSAAAQLNINGLGAQPLVKWGGVPLDSADLQPGVPVRLVYDGERFLLLGDTRLNCPVGYVTTSAAFCIEALPRTGADFFGANAQCAASGGRLCSFAEWSHACRTVPGFMTTVLEIEWVDEAANNTNYAKIMGIGEDGSNGSGSGCTFGGIRLPTNVNSYRCCTSR